MTTLLLAILLALVGGGVPQSGQKPQVRILEPTGETYLTGPVVMSAEVEPPSEAVELVTFFADGKVICRVPQAPFECRWNFGPLAEHVIRVEALISRGRRTAATVKTKSAIDPFNDYVDRVRVPVSVFDGNQFVRGLPHEAFRVFEDGVLQKTQFFPVQKSTLEIAVAIDISGSMTEVIDAVKENVKRFLSALRPEDRATVGAFNETYYVVAAPNLDRPEQLKKVDILAPWGMTSLYDVVLRSFDQLSAERDRRALVVFTDGADTASRVTKEAVERRVERSDAVLYIIGQGQVQQSVCKRLAEKSGGKAFFPNPKDLAALSAAFDAITEELSNQYLLTYDPRSSARDGRFHRIRVEVNGGYDVRHRDGRLANAK